MIGIGRQQPFGDLFGRNAQCLGEFGGVGRPPQSLGQFCCGAFDLLPYITNAPRHVDFPAIIAEVTAQFAHDRRNSKGNESGPVIGIESVDRLDQADPGDLDLANRVLSAAKQVTTVQEAPSIITVITSDEIRSRGYRDSLQGCMGGRAPRNPRPIRRRGPGSSRDPW